MTDIKYGSVLAIIGDPEIAEDPGFVDEARRRAELMGGVLVGPPALIEDSDGYGHPGLKWGMVSR